MQRFTLRPTRYLVVFSSWTVIDWSPVFRFYRNPFCRHKAALYIHTHTHASSPFLAIFLCSRHNCLVEGVYHCLLMSLSTHSSNTWIVQSRFSCCPSSCRPSPPMHFLPKYYRRVSASSLTICGTSFTDI